MSETERAMPLPGEDVPPGPAGDLRLAVTVALERDAHLLSAGEVLVARRYLALPAPAAALFARLLARKGPLFPLSTLAYDDVSDTPAAAAVLVEQQLATDALALAPTSAWVEAWPLARLKQACRLLGLPAGGRRADVAGRLTDRTARPLLAEPGLLLRHQGLFRRLSRLYLHDHQGDLSRLVLQRMGVVRYPPYTPTGGPGLFTDRAGLLAYEASLARRALLDGESLVADAPRAVAAFEASAPLPSFRHRFSARRFDEAIAFEGARQLERGHRTCEAASLYHRLLAAGSTHRDLIQRLALCMEQLGDVAGGARLCQAQLDRVRPDEALAVERTGRRLSRKARLAWTPSRPLLSPRARTVDLEAAPMEGPRPGWATGEGPTHVEEAIVALLAAGGRQAIHSEGRVWRTLFGLLFRDAILAPVAGMLPTALLHGPLDLGSPDFAPRRREWIDPVIAGLRAGEGPDRVREAWYRGEGEALAGLQWDLCTLDQLVLLAQALGPQLADVLEPFLLRWRGAARGMPDLVILPGPELRLPATLPSRLPAEVVLAEIKGPGDTLRDAQRVWLDRLRRAGLIAEVWNVRSRGPGLG